MLTAKPAPQAKQVSPFGRLLEPRTEDSSQIVNNISTHEERTLKTRRPTVFMAGPIRYLIELGKIIQYKKWILMIGNC